MAAMTAQALAFGLVNLHPTLSVTALGGLGGNLVQMCRQAAFAVAAGRSRAVEQATLNNAEKAYKSRLLPLWTLGWEARSFVQGRRFSSVRRFTRTVYSTFEA